LGIGVRGYRLGDLHPTIRVDVPRKGRVAHAAMLRFGETSRRPLRMTQPEAAKTCSRFYGSHACNPRVWEGWRGSMLKLPNVVDPVSERSLPARLGRLGMGHLVAVLIVGTVLLLVGATLAVLQGIADSDHEQHRLGLRNHAAALAEAVDLEFGRAEIALGTLSGSEALRRGDLDGFEAELQRLAVRLDGAGIGLVGADGRNLRGGGLPSDPQRGMVILPAIQAIALGTTQISDVTLSPVSGRPVTVVAVPILDLDAPRGGGMALVKAVNADRYAGLVAERRLPETPGLHLTIADRTGRAIVGTGGDGAIEEVFEAAPTTPGAMAAAAAAAGEVLVQARAPRSGYLVSLSVPIGNLRAPLSQARWRTIGLGIAVLGFSLGVAMLLARRLSRELGELASADAATHPPVSAGRGLREIDVLAATLARTRRERDRATAELRALFAVSPVGMARADLGGRVRDANSAFLAMVGLGPAELAAGEVRWDELTPPELLPRDEHAIAEAVRTGRCTAYEKAFLRADGTLVPVLVSLALLDRASGECAVFAVDLTDLKRTQAALAQSEDRLERALAAAEMASWDWDLEAGVIAGSPRREALFGRAPGSMRDGASLLSAVHPDDRAAMRMAMERTLDPDGDGTYEEEFRTVWPNGTVRWLHSRGCATRRDPVGRVLHMSGVVRDISALREAQERRELLVREVDHRAKNVLAVVQAVLKLTRADDPRDYAQIVEGRIAALAKAHTLLSRQRWAGADLRALLSEELAAFGGDERAGRVKLDGPSVFLSPWTVQPLTMALHELATNAAKYGALDAPQGRLEVQWEVQRDDGALLIRWTETGGAVQPPSATRKSFGTRVIDGAINDQLGGKIERRWDPDGLACRITLPPERIAGEVGPRPAIPRLVPPTIPSGAWSGRRVLVVEDDAVIAHSLVEALIELGIEPVGPASTLEQALALAATANSLDAAVLDINLGGRLAVPVADVLAGRGVPMVFASGYGSLPRDSLPDRHQSTPLLMKPVAAEAIVAALTRHAGAALTKPALAAE